MTVCSGPSGSGKSSLAIDTLYAEGQRRYVESLSSYARQFLAPLQKPKVERISGLSPAVSIEQKTTSKSPRSTVGTVTEIHDYLRILFARLGQPLLPELRPADRHPDGRRDRREDPPPARGDEGLRDGPGRAPRRRGLTRRSGTTSAARASPGSGSTASRSASTSPPKLSHRRKHRIEVVVDRAIVRRVDAVAAGRLGRVGARPGQGGRPRRPGRRRGRRAELARRPLQPAPRLRRLRPELRGAVAAPLLVQQPARLVPGLRGAGHPARRQPGGARSPTAARASARGPSPSGPTSPTNPPFARMIEAMAEALGIDLDTPFDDLDGRHRRVDPPRRRATPGSRCRPAEGQPGVLVPVQGALPGDRGGRRGSRSSIASSSRGWSTTSPAPSCMGARLRDDSAAVRFRDFTLDQISHWPLGRALDFFKELKLDGDEQHIAGDLVREIRDRLTFLVDVGLDYLSLARGTPTLSGGESQRIRLASQIGSGLTGVLYVLDEPTIGLHPRDNARLLDGPAAPPRPGQHAGPGRARPRGDRGGRPPRRLRPRLGRRRRRGHRAGHAGEGQGHRRSR